MVIWIICSVGINFILARIVFSETPIIFTFDDRAVKIFLSTKDYVNDVSTELKNFLNYLENGIIAGDFV